MLERAFQFRRERPERTATQVREIMLAAGVIENWDGHPVPAEAQIRAARAAGGRGMDARAIQGMAPGD
jgi:hypothetical protein